MSGSRAIFLAFVVLGLGLGSGQTLLLRLGYILVGVIVLAVVWSIFAVRGFEVIRSADRKRSQVGQVFTERLTVRNRSWLPRLWVELHDFSTLPDHPAGKVLSFRGRESISWQAETTCRRRGAYRLGPVALIGTDPFGLFRSRRLIEQTHDLLVYPPTVDLPRLKLPFGDATGGDHRQSGWHQITPHASSVREYQPGDGLNRIHWRSSARLQRLMVKEFDLDPAADIWIFLDMQAAVQHGNSEDPESSTEEYAISIGASVAKHFIERGRAVGLVALGDRYCIVPPDRGERQLTRLLEELTLIRATGEADLHDVLRSEGTRCHRNNLAIVVTSSVDERWITELRQLADRGVRTAAIVLEAATFGGPTSAILLVSSLAVAGIPTFLVKRGDHLDVALAATGVKIG